MTHATLVDLDDVMYDGRVRIERVTLGRMVAAGLDPDEIALLLDAFVLHGSTTSRRILERAAGGGVRIAIQSPFEALDDPVRDWDYHPYAYATVEIGRGLGWSRGHLYDTLGAIPATVAQAASGRPIGDVIVHPDVDPARAISTGGDPIATLRIDPEVVDLQKPDSTKTRLRVAAMRLRARRAEKETERNVRRGFMISALVAAASCAIRLIWPTPEGFVPHLIAGMAFGVLVVTTALVVDSNTGRLLTERWLLMRRSGASHYEDRAERKHREWLRSEELRRGFDEAGHALS